LVLFVDFRTLRAVRASKVASDYDSDGDADTQPGRNVAGGGAQRSANAGTQTMPSATCIDGLFIACLASQGWAGRPDARPPSDALRYFPLPSGFSVLSPIWRTLPRSSDIGIPDNVSNKAGTCAAIFAMSQ